MSATLSAEQRQPKTLKRLGETRFLIVWQDGHESEYPLSYLRRLCPCAGCAVERHNGQDIHSLFGPSGIGNTSRIIVSDNIRADDIQLVGRYALHFTWSDGHSTGIYSFETLRQMCPCPQCPTGVI